MSYSRIVAASSATEDFKDEALRYALRGRSDRVHVTRFIPPIKVVRLLTQLLSAEPELEVESVRIEGYSGCSDFVGTIDVHTRQGTHRFSFVWDCRWRAMQEELTDAFGFPDQITAAELFDWRCFRSWEPLESAEPRTPSRV